VSIRGKFLSAVNPGTSSKTCPQCGTPQQWEMWRHCGCGHDFGPGEGASETVSQRPTSSAESEEEDWLTEDDLRRFFRYASIGILIAFLLTHFIYPLDWLTNAAGFVMFVLFWDPSWFWKRKP
jgi:hypothetical protein